MVTAVLAEVGYQSNWIDALSSEFMQHAFMGGALVALAAGAMGYFVVVRQHAFAAHALAHIGFPGATGALLVGAPVMLGLAVFCIGGSLAIAAFGEKLAERDVATGSILAFATALGVLFSSLSTRSANTVTNVLFGNLLAISAGDLIVFGCFTAGLLAVMVMIGRPLVFASVTPRVAEARGVPVRALNVAFMVLLALVVTMAIEVVGTLLLFGLVVTPAATALVITARPLRVAFLAGVIALASVACGLVLSAMFNLPPSFLIVGLSFVVWVATHVVKGSIRRRARASDNGGLAPAASRAA